MVSRKTAQKKERNLRVYLSSLGPWKPWQSLENLLNPGASCDSWLAGWVGTECLTTHTATEVRNLTRIELYLWFKGSARCLCLYFRSIESRRLFCILDLEPRCVDQANRSVPSLPENCSNPHSVFYPKPTTHAGVEPAFETQTSVACNRRSLSEFRDHTSTWSTRSSNVTQKLCILAI